jgi:hypothetical protein
MTAELRPFAVAFVKAYPWVNIEHAQAIFATVERCPACADWHRKDEEHSMTEGGW